ncbi:MAG: peptidoglycan editing factor PgeF [Pseudomonadota bacterium]
MNDAVTLWRADTLGAVPHGFAGRRGGVSSGAIASLNCGMGAGDDPAAVAVNRRRAADAVLPNAALTSVYQVHGRACVTVREPWADDARPQADALVTDRPEIVLGIVTADCVPVLLADKVSGVVGAAHAGWKGALAGVTDAALSAMEALGAQRGRIVAAIGPCIARASYEVDRTLFDAFTNADPTNERFFLDGQPDHWQFDLEAYVAARLAAAGVPIVEAMGLDTYARIDDFYSYRRATHRGEPTYGRQLSMIGLPQ